MKEIRDSIITIKEFHSTLSDIDDDFMDDLISLDFLSSKEIQIINCLSKIPESKWTTNNYCSAYIILKEHKDSLEELDINFNSLPTPDLTCIELKNTNNLIKIKNSRELIVSKKICSSIFYKPENENENYFSVKINLDNIIAIRSLIEDKTLFLSQNVLALINLYLNNVKYEKEIKNIFDVKGYNKTPMPFQKTAILFGLLNKKVLIADEMGLGKSVIALSTIQMANAFCSLIVCPKSLKYKWLNEASFLEGKTVEIISDKTNFNNLDKDIYIVNYDNIKKYADEILKSSNFKSVIFDESHYLKNPKTIRSKVCLSIARKMEYIIQLTGSPILNKPSELIHQIDILDKLSIFGSHNEFINKYCYDEKNYRNRDIVLDQNEPNYAELAEKLRSNIYIRREKSEILKDLPEKQRTTLLVDINKKEYNEKLNQYRKESDKKKKKRILEQLKSIAANNKLESIIERIDECVENNQKVVVFAYHREIQSKLIEQYPNALKIVSSQDENERFRNAEEFQNNDQEFIIICSIKVAYFGFDLFASSQAIFAEMDWVPDINCQAEDRLHRIGQLKSVNVWYIIAKDTIEENILKANEEKTNVISKINKKVETPEIISKKENIKDQVIKMLDCELNLTD